MTNSEVSVQGYVTDPAASGGLDLRELSSPEPAAGEALVDVRAYAINRGELALLTERPQDWRPGQDLAGVVSSQAADGTGPPAGTRVVGLAEGGAWSRQVAVSTTRLAPLPDATSFEDAAALPVAGLTALRALRTGGPLLGRRVLVTGSSGGVGSFAIQLARLAGAQVTAHVSGKHRADIVAALGADEVVTAIDGSTGPFDHVLEAVGGPVLAAAIHRLAPQGTIAAYGLASGERTPLAFYDFAAAQLGRLVGFFLYATEQSEPFGHDLATLTLLVGDGRVRVQRASHYDWSQTQDAIAALRERKVTGKAVLTVT